MNAELAQKARTTHSQIVSIFLERKNFYFSICLFAFDEFSFDAETIETRTARLDRIRFYFCAAAAADIASSNQHERNRRNKPKKTKLLRNHVGKFEWDFSAVLFRSSNVMWVCRVEAKRSNGRNRTHDTTVTAQSGSLRFEWQITVGRFAFSLVVPLTISISGEWWAAAAAVHW